MSLSHKRLKELLHYSPKSGVFTWRMTHASSQYRIGTRAGGLKDSGGYRVLKIDNHRYYEHRLALFYMNGKWPKQVDHRDLDKANNKWDNLRLANKSLNGANRKPPRTTRPDLRASVAIGEMVAGRRT